MTYTAQWFAGSWASPSFKLVLLALFTLGTISPGVLFAQDDDDDPLGLPSTLSYGFDVQGMYDTNILRDPEAQAFGASGSSVDAIVDYQNAHEQPRFFVRAEAGVNRFARTDERDYWRLRLRTAYRSYLSDAFNVDVVGRVSIGVITAEYLFADQYNVIGRLEYDPGYHHRFRVYGSYRRREYRDKSGTGAHSPYGIISYRYRFGSWHYWDTDAWFEANMAEIDRRSFYRYSAVTSYTRPLSSDHRLRAGVEYQHQPYHDYPTENDLEDRVDRRWIGNLTWIADVYGPIRLYTGYELRTRLSNAEDRDYTSHRFTLRAQVRW